MANWHDKLLDFIAEDWLRFLDGFHNETFFEDWRGEPYICAHFREEYASDPRVWLKGLFASEDASPPFLYEGCRELSESGKLKDATAYDDISPSNMNEVREFGRSLLDAIPPSTTACVRAMECYWDLESGSRSLATPESLKQELQWLRGYATNRKKMKKWVVKEWPESPSTLFLQKVIRKMLCRDAEHWLGNAGAPTSRRSEGRAKAQTKGIPLALVEMILRREADLACDLNVAKPKPKSLIDAGSSRAEDLERLYWSLNDGWHNEAVVPICINQSTGIGLYIMGSGLLFAYEDENDDVIRGTIVTYCKAQFGTEVDCERLMYSFKSSVAWLKLTDEYGEPFTEGGE